MGKMLRVAESFCFGVNLVSMSPGALALMGGPQGGPRGTEANGKQVAAKALQKNAKGIRQIEENARKISEDARHRAAGTSAHGAVYEDQAKQRALLHAQAENGEKIAAMVRDDPRHAAAWEIIEATASAVTEKISKADQERRAAEERRKREEDAKAAAEQAAKANQGKRMEVDVYYNKPDNTVYFYPGAGSGFNRISKEKLIEYYKAALDIEGNQEEVTQLEADLDKIDKLDAGNVLPKNQSRQKMWVFVPNSACGANYLSEEARQKKFNYSVYRED